MKDRNQISQDIALFIRNGGAIQHVPGNAMQRQDGKPQSRSECIAHFKRWHRGANK